MIKIVLYITEIKKIPGSAALLVTAENSNGRINITFECNWRHSEVNVGQPITVDVAMRLE